jgi:dTDP-4-dehydrorhamnose reductase
MFVSGYKLIIIIINEFKLKKRKPKIDVTSRTFTAAIDRPLHQRIDLARFDATTQPP